MFNEQKARKLIDLYQERKRTVESLKMVQAKGGETDPNYTILAHNTKIQLPKQIVVDYLGKKVVHINQQISEMGGEIPPSPVTRAVPQAVPVEVDPFEDDDEEGLV